MSDSPYSDKILQQTGVSDFINIADNPRATLRRQHSILQRWEQERERMHAVTKLDPELIDRMQLERIRQIVDSAFVTHPFYHQLYANVGYSTGEIVTWDDYHALPTVSKAQLYEARDQFPGRILPERECYASQTSGTSGEALTIFQDDAANASAILSYLRYYEQALGRQRRRDEWVYRIYSTPLRFTSLEGNYPLFTLSPDCPPERVPDHLALAKPTVFKAPPSYLSQMIALGRPLTDLGISVVCTHSELSTQEERKEFANAFGADVYDEYASEELYLIATQCGTGIYHIVDDNVRVDVVRDTGLGNAGSLVATTLTNDYMPFIRYLQGDIVEIEDQSRRCQCGSTFRVMTKLYGREDDLLRRKDGSLVDLDRVLALRQATLTEQSGVSESTMFQIEPTVLELLVQPTAGRDMRDNAPLTAFTNGLREIYGPDELTLSVRIVGSMPVLVRRKPRPRPHFVVGGPPPEA